MASKTVAVPARQFLNGFRSSLQHVQRRRLATQSALPTSPNVTLSQAYHDAHLNSAPTEAILRDEITTQPVTPLSHVTLPSISQQYHPPPNPFRTKATCTTHAFPSFEPTSFAHYPSTHLLLPLRKDILHRAVIYEGDNTRQGTASTKWRSEVHGSNRKIRPQKGTGKARLGNKKSPMLRGGGVAFGPKPRDFGTKLPRKIYDLAWRTALSYRYRQGELLLLEDQAEIDNVHQDSAERYVKDLLRYNKMGHADGRTLFVTLERRERLFGALEGEKMGREARALDVTDVDVKDLMELGRVVMEKQALEFLFEEHESDLVQQERLSTWK